MNENKFEYRLKPISYSFNNCFLIKVTIEEVTYDEVDTLYDRELKMSDAGYNELIKVIETLDDVPDDFLDDISARVEVNEDNGMITTTYEYIYR